MASSTAQSLSYGRPAEIAAEATAPVDLFTRGVRRLFSLAERHRSRKALRNLDQRLLRDIGVTGFDASIEADKPFWRL